VRGQSIKYSDAEIAWLEANRTLPIGDYTAAFNAAFGRAEKTANLHALRKRRRWKTGRTGHFSRGQDPVNKGQKCPPGQGGRHPNAVRTQFQQGRRQGVAVNLYKPIGTERVSDGYLTRKVNDDMPLQKRWRAVHLINWEALHGPIPEGHCLKCLGDKTNTDPSNWKLIPRAMLPALAGGHRKNRPGYDGAADELKPTLMALAEIEDRARNLRRQGVSA
jgi:hypothetical protein